MKIFSSNNSIRTKDKALLMLVPIFLFTTSILYIDTLYYFFLSWSDPGYAYLFNGLNFATFHRYIGHIDHPGTPLQLFCAFIIRIQYLFCGSGGLPEHVMSNPESYLRTISFSLTLISTLIAYYTGRVIFIKSRNFSIAMLFQASVLFSAGAILYIPIIACETIIISTFSLLLLLCFLYTYHPESLRKWLYPIGFGFLVALIITTKFSTAPFFVIPLFLLKTWKERLLFVTMCILFIAAILIPVMPLLANHFDFIFRIATHTGKYGFGDQGVFVWPVFFAHIVLIFKYEIPFTIAFSFLFLTFVSTLILKKIRIRFTKAERNLIYGIFIFLIIQIGIVAKHYASHYMIPAHLMSGLAIFITFPAFFSRREMYEKFIHGKFFKWLTIFVLLFLAFFLCKNLFYKNLHNDAKDTMVYAEQNRKLPIIILSQNLWEGAYIESSLFFGATYSGETRTQNMEFLNSKYPNTYFYGTYNHQFFNWKGPVVKIDFFSKNPQVMIYSRNFEPDSISSAINELFDFPGMKNLYQYKTVYKNHGINESILELTCDTAAIKKLFYKSLSLKWDLENTDESKVNFIDQTGKYFLSGVNQKSKETSKSGNFSVKLTPESQYSLAIKIKTHPGYFYIINAWRKSDTEKSCIVTCAQDQSKYYTSGANILEKQNDGWEKIQFSTTIPKEYPDSLIHIYFWNNSKSTVFFDDVTIDEYSPK
ncbi:MAG: hypothetical protein V2A54_07430 [Bacteroidota bacterium]